MSDETRDPGRTSSPRDEEAREVAWARASLACRVRELVSTADVEDLHRLAYVLYLLADAPDDDLDAKEIGKEVLGV